MRHFLAATGLMLLSVSIESSTYALEPRPAAIKPVKTIVSQYHRKDAVFVKFKDDLIIRAENGELTDRGTGSIEQPMTALLAKHAAGRWTPDQAVGEVDLVRLRDTAQSNLNKAVADLRTQFVFELPPGAAPGTVIDEFNALDVVEIALPMPLPAPLPLPPNYQPAQGYLGAATAGVGAVGMWGAPYNSTGAGVKIADIEYSWNPSHQDLPPVTLIGPSPLDPYSDNNHGTSVFGIMASLSNGWGTTGIARNASYYFVAANTSGGGYNVGAAIVRALLVLGPGDIILIEQQFFGPNYTGAPPDVQFGMVPAEWWLPTYNAIVTAVGNQVTVVEAAGNGSQNLDSAIYQTGNGGHYPFLPQNDSGAIIVGAGGAPSSTSGDRARLSYSCYGATVDLQGWGESIYTTGYGYAYSAEGVNLYYMHAFGGTSGASPIVTGACALIQSIYKSANPGQILSPARVKNNLRATGSPQLNGFYPASQNIGPRPNVIAAAVRIPGDMNCDGVINGRDIPHFVQALVSPSAYVASHSTCSILHADLNGDSLVNLSDVESLNARLLSD